MNTITVTISGPTGAGKSTLAQIIRWACSLHNIKVLLQDPEDTDDLITYHRRCQSVAENSQVIVQQVNTVRGTA